MDTPHFIERAKQLYGYSNFVCDSGGSICEVVDPWNPKDPILNTLSKNLLLVWIKGSEEHTSELISRFDQAPKPMCYQADFLLDALQGYQDQTVLGPNKIDPNDFIRRTYARAMAHREPRYAQMANWGITVNNGELCNSYKLKSFMDVMSFANLVADKAEQIKHHPKIIIDYSKILFALVTHDIEGLSYLDF